MKTGGLPNDDVAIRPARPGDRDAILQFVEAMGFNPRDAVTWDALHMTAMTAWRGGRLVGAIPMEPRMLQLRPGLVVPTLHQTVVAVHPDERSKGIGSQMQVAIAERAANLVEPNETAPIELLTVFREEPDSPAYRWYRSNGFSPAMNIGSWFLESPESRGSKGEGEGVPSPDSPSQSLRLRATQLAADDVKVDYPNLADQWDQAQGQNFGGFVYRRSRPLREWLVVHPYRSRYRFFIVLVRDMAGAPAGYALLGVGKLHSESIRADILELIAPNTQRRQQILTSVIAVALQNDWRPIRWPIAAGDSDALELANSHGFERKWDFDLLVKPLPTATAQALESLAKDSPAWRYASVDYI